MTQPLRFLSRPLSFALLAASAALAASLFAACDRAAAADARGTVEASALLAQIQADDAPLILDVRSPGEYAAGHVPGAINIPVDEIAARSAEIEAHKQGPTVLYCRSGRRAGMAADALAGKGFTGLSLLRGDMPGWEEAGYPVEKSEE